MLRFILRNIAGFLLTLLLVSLLIAGIFSLIPGDPALLAAGIGASPEQVQALRESLGIRGGIFQRYGLWLRSLFTGQTVYSTQYNMPVYRLIAGRMAVTSSIALLATVLMLLAACPLGLLSGYRKNTWIDGLVGNLSVLGLSTPNYLSGIVMIWLCGLVLRLFTPGGFVPFAASPARYWQSLFFPALAVALPNAAMLTRFIRASVIKELRSGYVYTARSRGAGPLRILFSHIARNGATSVLTAAGILIADILSGSIVVEQVFALPGLGRLLIGGINARDFPLVLSITAYTAFVVAAVNFVCELLARLCDPRMRAT